MGRIRITRHAVLQEKVFARLAAALAAAALGLTAGAPAAAAPNVRISSGTSTDDFLGEAIGVDLVAGRFVVAWTDNSAELGGNPDRPALDVAFAGVTGELAAPNVNVTQAPLSQFSTSVAVDPTDPDTILVAALGGSSSDSRPAALRALSRDAGATWTVVDGLPGNFGGFAPAVAFDAFGNCFLALVHDPAFGNPHLELFVSVDGGATFTPVSVPDPPGTETNVTLAAGFGAVWLAFESYDGAARIQALAAPVTASGEVGAFAAQPLPGSAEGRRPDIALAPGGVAVVAYGHGAFTQAPTVSVQVDADGLAEAGFGPRISVANVPGYPNLPRPRLAIDDATGRIHVVYPDRQGNGPEEIRLNFSDDGSDWSAAITVNDPVAAVNRELPDVAVDGGTVGVAWYDSRNGGAQLWGDLRSGVASPAEPRAPLNLLAAGASHSRIDLSWTDTSDNEQGFQIERSTGNPFEQPPIVATLPPNTTTWSDDGLPADSGFGYRVRAFNAAGPSLWSNRASATTFAFPPPAPRNLTATAITFQRIDLAWEPVSEADSYEVQQSTDGVAFTTISRPIVTQMMIFGLRPSTTYFFRVRAINSGAESPWSNVASATTLAEDQPAAPTELRAVALSKSRILLEWRDNSVNETRFEIGRSTGGAFTIVGKTNADAQRFLDSGLRRSTTYTYAVRACNATLCSPFSSAVSVATPG